MVAEPLDNCYGGAGEAQANRSAAWRIDWVNDLVDSQSPGWRAGLRPPNTLSGERPLDVAGMACPQRAQHSGMQRSRGVTVTIHHQPRTPRSGPIGPAHTTCRHRHNISFPR